MAAGLACLSTFGGHKASVKQIASMAGVNHGLVHYYFGSKEKLIVALFRRMADGQRGALERVKGPEDLRIMLAKYAVPNARLILEFALMARSMPELAAELHKELTILARLSADRMAKGDLRDGWLLVSAVAGLALHAEDMGEMDMDYISHRLMDWVNRG